MPNEITQAPRPSSMGSRANLGASGTDDADRLLQQAQEAQEAQLAQLAAFPLASQYSAALAAQVEATHDQVERIEDKLAALGQQQAARLAQLQAQQPGPWSLPGARAGWQQQVAQRQNRLQQLQRRVESVREIKEGMGLHGPRLEELAARKLRAQEPALAEAWDGAREAARRHQAIQRNDERERKQSMQRAAPEGSRSLGLSQLRGQ
jgi:hypothetical protein